MRSNRCACHTTTVAQRAVPDPNFRKSISELPMAYDFSKTLSYFTKSELMVQPDGFLLSNFAVPAQIVILSGP